MHTVYYFIEHPYVLAVLLIAAFYAWGTMGSRQLDPQRWGAKRAIRVFGPSVAVLILVTAASAGLKHNLSRVDFGMFYSSAQLLRQDPRHLYDQKKQTEYLHAATGLANEPHYLPFTYPPFVAFVFAPMTVLSFRSAYFVMLALNIALLGFILWWLSSRLKFRQDQIITLLVSASAALPLYAVLVLGHLTFVGILLLSLFIIDTGTHRSRAGFWAGLMLYKPILFPVPLLILLWKRQWKGIALFLAVATALLSLSFILVGWNGIRSNVLMLRLMTSDYLLPTTQSLRGLVFAAGLGTISWVILACIALAALCLGVMRAPNQRWILSAAIIAVMLVPPYLQFHDLAIGLVGIAVALTTMSVVSDGARNFLFLINLLPALLVLASPRDHPIFPIMPVILAMLFAFCLWKAFRSGSYATL